jgi:predicted RecB family nuclease
MPTEIPARRLARRQRQQHTRDARDTISLKPNVHHFEHRESLPTLSSKSLSTPLSSHLPIDRSHVYVQILEERAKANRARHVAEITQRSGNPCPSDANLLSTGPDFLVNVSIRSSDLEARCDVLTKVKTSSGLGRYSYEPTIVTGTYSPTPEQKTGLSFTGYVLGQVQTNLPFAGTLLNCRDQAKRILLAGSYASIKTILRTLRGWIASAPPEPPPVILNKHCPYCQFGKECTELAVKDDNLSLLDRITPPLIKNIPVLNKSFRPVFHSLTH